MSWKISWSQVAREQYAELLLYVEANYGLNSAEKLFNKVENTLQHISVFPKIFPYSKKLNGRKAVISRQTSIIYIILDDEVFILKFKDNRVE